MFTSLEKHMLSDSDVFSLSDLERVYNGDLPSHLEPIVQFGKYHIENCEVSAFSLFLLTNSVCDRSLVSLPNPCSSSACVSFSRVKLSIERLDHEIERRRGMEKRRRKGRERLYVKLLIACLADVPRAGLQLCNLRVGFGPPLSLPNGANCAL